MKKIFKLAAVVCAFASLAACTKYADYNWVPFTSLDKASLKVAESESGTTVSLPVHVYNAGACSVTYDIVDVSAKQGVDYIVPDGSGVLNFTESEDTQSIHFNIKGQPGVYTGDVKFKVVLKSATDGVTIGSINTCTVTISDNDHPLASILGPWTVTHAGSAYSPNKFTTNFEPVEGDVHKIWITNLDNDSCSGSFIGIVSDDFSTITVPVGQLSTGMYGGQYNVVLWGLADSGSFLDETDIEAVKFTLEEHVYYSDYGFGIMAADGNYEVLGYLNYMFGPVCFSR